MKLYELITFTVRVRTVAIAMVCLEQRLLAQGAGVKLMGCWASEVGPLNQIAMLRGFADEASRQVERERYLAAADAFGIEAYLMEMRVENYSLFPFLQPLPAGRHGPFYEFRIYDLLPSGLAPTLRGWKKRWAPEPPSNIRRYMPPSMPPTVSCLGTCTSGRTTRSNSAWTCAPVPYRMASGRRKTQVRNCATCIRRSTCRRAFRRCCETAADR